MSCAATDMSCAATDLPDDPDELRRFAAALAAEVHAKTLLIEKLKMQLAALRRARFGRSSEKLDREIEQLELAIGELEEGAAQSTASQEAVATHQQDSPIAALAIPRPQKSVPARKPLPAHLPRERVD